MTQKQTMDDLRREIGRICGGGGRWHDMTKQPVDARTFIPAPKDSRLKPAGSTQTREERGPFGRWLLRQPEEGLRAGLIQAAKRDPKWPANGDAQAAASRLRECGADGDMFAALEEAELDWISI